MRNSTRAGRTEKEDGSGVGARRKEGRKEGRKERIQQWRANKQVRDLLVKTAASPTTSSSSSSPNYRLLSPIAILVLRRD